MASPDSDLQSPYATSVPPHRRLRVYAKDPSLAARSETAAVNDAVIEVPWESPSDLAPGPVGEYVEVVDYDPSCGCYYKPLDLNDGNLLAQDGVPPSEGNPQFHQQMVYAVSMRTIRNFERALGRRALWARRKGGGRGFDAFVKRLRIYPHALREANAYYSPRKKALLFGYFPARPASASEQLPGGIVFTCLSHDIVAHETAHALLDGMHERFTERSNRDVLAFHEAFADIVALFQQFSIQDVLRHVLAQTRGQLGVNNLLAGLAKEFGHATGRRGALRSAIDVDPDPASMEAELEPHKRGAILVAAIFEAFLTIYQRRTRDLFRLATGGTGVLPKGAVHPDLVERLTHEASKTAQHVLTMCIRALDYLPPVDVNFGNYVQALITADYDLVPDDRYNYRVAFMDGFRRRGIYPRHVRSFSEEGLRWQGPDFLDAIAREAPKLTKALRDVVRTWSLDGDRREVFDSMEALRRTAHTRLTGLFEHKKARRMGLDLEALKYEVHSIRPVRRTGPEGRFLMDAVIEVTQRLPGLHDGGLDAAFAAFEKDGVPKEEPPFWFRGGATLILDLDSGMVRHCIFKDIRSEQRYRRQQRFVCGSAVGDSTAETYFGMCGPGDCDEVFAFLHRG